MEEPSSDPDVTRLVKRMWRSAHGLFTFLTTKDVDPTNNWAEINIRPAVVMRKNSYGNRSTAGANVQAILMSIFRTFQLRGESVIDAVIAEVEREIQARHRQKTVKSRQKAE